MVWVTFIVVDCGVGEQRLSFVVIGNSGDVSGMLVLRRVAEWCVWGTVKGRVEP